PALKLGAGPTATPAALALVAGVEAPPAYDPAAADPNRWPAKKAWQWYHQQPWLCGFNYIPATAINYTEMWQKETFDPKTIDEELTLAEQVRFNSLRCVL